MRHAFDADHISAIDNTTRKLLGDGQRPMTVGFWFSLGHSTIVFGLALLLSFGVRALAGPVEDDSSALHHYTGLIGTTVSGGFLYLIAAINIVILFGIVKVFRAMRQGDYSEDELENHLNNRGFMNRILGRFMKSVTKPWQMYPIGSCSGWASTPRPRSPCSSSPAVAPPPDCPGTRSCACRSCSPRV